MQLKQPYWSRVGNSTIQTSNIEMSSVWVARDGGGGLKFRIDLPISSVEDNNK